MKNISIGDWVTQYKAGYWKVKELHPKRSSCDYGRIHKGDPIYIGAHEEVTFFREGRKRGNEFRANEDYASYVHDLDDVPVLVSDGPNPRQLAVYWIGENECKDPVPVDIDDAVELCPSLVSKFYLKKLSPYFHLD